jgi:hypothetical protein
MCRFRRNRARIPEKNAAWFAAGYSGAVKAVITHPVATNIAW